MSVPTDPPPNPVDRFCEGCGAAYGADDRFCGECGRTRGGVAAEPTAVGATGVASAVPADPTGPPADPPVYPVPGPNRPARVGTPHWVINVAVIVGFLVTAGAIAAVSFGSAGRYVQDPDDAYYEARAGGYDNITAPPTSATTPPPPASSPTTIDQRAPFLDDAITRAGDPQLNGVRSDTPAIGADSVLAALSRSGQKIGYGLFTYDALASTYKLVWWTTDLVNACRRDRAENIHTDTELFELGCPGAASGGGGISAQAGDGSSASKFAIRNIDFRNTTLPARSCAIGDWASAGPLPVVNGTGHAGNRADTSYAEVHVDKPASFADLDGDGAEDALLVVGCTAGGNAAETLVVPLRLRNGTLELIGSNLFAERPEGGRVDGAVLDGNDIVISERSDATGSEPRCCYTRTARVRWHWDGSGWSNRPA